MFVLNFQISTSASSNPAMSKPLVQTQMETIPVPVILDSLVMELVVKVFHLFTCNQCALLADCHMIQMWTSASQML